jgi:hypothetical protein
MSLDASNREKGREMDAISHHRSARQSASEAKDGSVRRDMEASARVLMAADNAHVQEAMNSVDWERRGLLQRLTRRAR